MLVLRPTVLASIAIVAIALAAHAQADAALAGPRLAPLKVLDVAYMDTTVKACTDFSRFANGGWLARDTIPAVYSSSGVARDMADRNELVVRSVLDDVMRKRASLPAGSTPRKLGTYYATCMDSAAAEREGIAPIEPELAAASAISTRARLLDEITRLQITGHNVLFQYGPGVDSHDAAHYTAWLSQGGLGLPDRDYYTREGAGPDSVRTKYLAHIAKLLTLSGEPPSRATRDAQLVYALEKQLATASLTRVAMRDPAATDHPMSTQQLASLAPHVTWTRYFHNAGVPRPVTRVIVAQPEFFKRADSLLASAPLPQWRAYLRYHVLSTAVAVAQHAVRERELRLQLHIQRRQGVAAALEALPPQYGQPDGRGARPGVRRAHLSAGGARPRAAGDRRHPDGVRRAAAEARVDVRHDARAGTRQAGEDGRRRWVIRTGGATTRSSTCAIVRSCSTTSARTRSSGIARQIVRECPSTRPSGGSPCLR